MRFEKISPDKIKITLTSQDMAGYHLTYRQMDYSDPQTRSVLQTLLELAESRAGFSCPDRSRLLIELFPTISGGCTVVFTLLGTAEEISCCTYTFTKLEPLTQCAVKAIRQGICPHPEGCCCSLYRMESSYRILCRPSRYPPSCLPVLEEYGFFTGDDELTAAYTAEHGKLIAAPDALARLAKYLG